MSQSNRCCKREFVDGHVNIGLNYICNEDGLRFIINDLLLRRRKYDVEVKVNINSIRRKKSKNHFTNSKTTTKIDFCGQSW